MSFSFMSSFNEMDFTENSLARFFRDSAWCWFGYVPFLPWNETGGKKNYETNLIDKRENSKKLENENDERGRHITSLKSHRIENIMQHSRAEHRWLLVRLMWYKMMGIYHKNSFHSRLSSSFCSSYISNMIKISSDYN